MKQVAVFGGAFDPIHCAHLILAQDILLAIASDTILFLPSSTPPHKRCFAAFDDRLKMVELAIRGNPRFKSSGIEAGLPEPTFTIQTLRALQKELPDASISFIMGMDSAVEFSTWKEPTALLDEFRMIVIPRPGCAECDVDKEFRERMTFLQIRTIAISSTEIRDRIKAGKEIRYLTPNEVISYIAKKGLYR
jgi:nicotinate-nucleotide adenylyltransferase